MFGVWNVYSTSYGPICSKLMTEGRDTACLMLHLVGAIVTLVPVFAHWERPGRRRHALTRCWIHLACVHGCQTCFDYIFWLLLDTPCTRVFAEDLGTSLVLWALYARCTFYSNLSVCVVVCISVNGILLVSCTVCVA